MTTLKSYFPRITSIFTLLFALLMITSCVSKTEFLASKIVPAARGDVKIKKDKNLNYQIQLQVQYLAESDRLQPPRNTYVIWMDNALNQTKNIGQFNTSAHSPSTNLKASFEAVSSTKPVRVYISAEDDPAASYPSSQIVLTTDRILK